MSDNDGHSLPFLHWEAYPDFFHPTAVRFPGGDRTILSVRNAEKSSQVGTAVWLHAREYNVELGGCSHVLNVVLTCYHVSMCLGNHPQIPVMKCSHHRKRNHICIGPKNPQQQFLDKRDSGHCHVTTVTRGCGGVWGGDLQCTLGVPYSRRVRGRDASYRRTTHLFSVYRSHCSTFTVRTR